MVYIFFPLFAAMFYGLAFAFTEKALKLVDISTYLILGALAGVAMASSLVVLRGQPLSFDFINNTKSLAVVAVAVLAPSFGWLFTMFAIKTTSASYAAFAEISYPLFTVLFLALFFGLRTLDWTIILGGALIMGGSFLMIWGQSK